MRLSLSAARRLCSHLAALVAYGAMASGGEMPLPVTAIFVAGVAASLLKGDRQIPGLAASLTLLTAGAGVVLVFLVAQGPLDLVLGAGLFGAMVCLNRLLARRSAADDPLLLLTTLLLLAAGAALSGEAAYGLCFVVYAFAGTLALTFSHLERASELAGLSGRARDALLSRNLFGALLGLCALAVVGAVAVFIFFPRINAQWLGRRGAAPRAQVGFAEEVQLGGVGTLRSDPRPALRVRFPGFDADHVPRALLDDTGRLDLLWRGVSLDTFDGHRWSAARLHHPDKLLPWQAPEQVGVHARVEVLPVTDTRRLFSPGIAAAARLISLDSAAERNTPHLLQVSAHGDAFVSPAPQGFYAYEVWTRAVDPDLRGRGRDYPDIAKVDLQLPEGLDPRIPALARTWVGAATDPFDQARLIVRHLREDFAYTTELPGDSADPIAQFLFQRKAGHCEFFSSAMVLMLRTLGVPAREVTGFAGGERAGDYFLIRAGDAHSWAEVYLPGAGFVAFDPSPAAARSEGATGFSAWLSAVADEASDWWRRAVVDYDLRTQVDAVRAAGQAMSRAARRFSRDEDAPGAMHWRAWLALAAIAALLGLAVRVIRRRGLPGGVEGPEAARCWRALHRELGRRGVPVAPGETARELVARLRRDHPELSAASGELCELYERSRFARAPWTATERARAAELVSSVREARPGSP